MKHRALSTLICAAAFFSSSLSIAKPNYAGITATENVGVQTLLATDRGGPKDPKKRDVKFAGTYYTQGPDEFALGIDTAQFDWFSTMLTGSVQPKTQDLTATALFRANMQAVTPRVGVHHNDQTWALAGVQLDPNSLAGVSLDADLLTNGDEIDADGSLSFTNDGFYLSAGGNLGQRLLMSSQAYAPGAGFSLFNQIWHNTSTQRYGGRLAIAGNSNLTSQDISHYDTTLVDVQRRGILRGWDPQLPNFASGTSFAARWNDQEDLQADALIYYTHKPDYFFGAGAAYNGLPGCPGAGIMFDEATPINQLGLQQRITLAVNEDFNIGVVLEIGQKF